MSIAGMRSDQTDAATITPAANPSETVCMKALCTRPGRSTTAAPTAVMKKVKPVAPAAAATGEACERVSRKSESSMREIY